MPAADTYILAIDQGTSSTKAMIIDRRGGVVAIASAPVGQSHPQAGWVEQSASEIWTSIRSAVRQCMAENLGPRLDGIALSVQRESVLLWDRSTGEVIGPVLSWQDQRTTAAADVLERDGHAAYIFATTGLPLDPMFSALKAQWLLDRFDPQRTHTRAGEWCVGTLDAWILSRFGGDPVTEVGNASRTQLLDIHAGSWDPTLLDMFVVPVAGLPKVVGSTGPFPSARGLPSVPDGAPVLAVLADSHAALFAHAGWRPGLVKATYGTGSSVMALGPRVDQASGLCSTIAWQVDDIAYALEANIRSTGRTLTWLADLFGLDVEVLWDEAATATSDGVSLVPAFGGLGAPYWERDATALISGLSLGTARPQLARAALEAITHQVDDVLQAFVAVVGPLHRLASDGGMTRSRALMQLQADLSGLPVHISATAELSAMGAAQLAGLAAGWWDYADLEARLEEEDRRAAGGDDLLPQIDDEERARRRTRWNSAVRRTRSASPSQHESEATA